MESPVFLDSSSGYSQNTYEGAHTTRTEGEYLELIDLMGLRFFPGQNISNVEVSAGKFGQIVSTVHPETTGDSPVISSKKILLFEYRWQNLIENTILTQ